MDKLKLFLLNNKKIFILFLVFVFIILFVGIYYFVDKEKKTIIYNDDIYKEIYTESEFRNECEKKDEEIIDEFISVDIKGRVKKPGVYQVNSKLNRRVSDIITMAGGLLSDADTSVTNLAKKLFDEMVIIVYSKNEVKEFSKTLEKEEIKNNICNNNCDSCIEKDNLSNNSNNLEQENIEKKLININTATVDELMTLPGIGESKALAIISYREKNLFEKIEDIMNIAGIKEGAFEKIKDYITI